MNQMDEAFAEDEEYEAFLRAVCSDADLGSLLGFSIRNGGRISKDAAIAAVQAWAKSTFEAPIAVTSTSKTSGDTWTVGFTADGSSFSVAVLPDGSVSEDSVSDSASKSGKGLQTATDIASVFSSVVDAVVPKKRGKVKVEEVPVYDAPESDNTLLYVGAGVSVLIFGGLAVFVMTRG